MQGTFIAVEGGDGAGKGTAIAALHIALTKAGHDVLLTREPGGTPEGLALRSMLLSTSGSIWDGRAELLLMAAARVQHVHRTILPALAANRIVLCDRFVASTLAYQGGGRGIDADFIRTLHRHTTDDTWPALTILLDLDPLIGLHRSRRRLQATETDEGRFEQLDLAFHQRVRSAYRALAAHTPGWVTVDAAQSPDVVAATALAAVLTLLSGS